MSEREVQSPVRPSGNRTAPVADRTAPSRDRAAPAQAAPRRPVLTCRGCGYTGRMTPFGRTPKQLLFRACLWLLVLLPGYLYDFAIRDRYVCPKCKAEVYAR